MAVETVYIGRYRSSTRDPDYGTISTNTHRANIFGPTSQHLWGEQFGVIAGYSSGGSATIRIGLYKKEGATFDDDLLAYSEVITLDSLMADASGGDWEYGDPEWSDLGPLDTSIAIPSGTTPALDIWVVSGAVAHNMSASSRQSAPDQNFYQDSQASFPDPWDGATILSNEGLMTVWLKCRTNEAPRSPANRSISGDIDDLTPTFEADFRDRNGSWGPANDGYDNGDIVKRVQIRVWNTDTSTLIWDKTYSASSGEQAADRTSYTYDGPTLVRGTNYAYDMRHSDQFDAWGDYASQLAFRVVTAGSMATTSPSGTIQEVDPDFSGVWSHASSLSTASVRVRVKKGASVIADSGAITKTVTAGSSFTITWAETGFDDLGWGEDLTFELLGVDTGAVSSAWSSGLAFSTNHAPTVPSSLWPDGGSIHTTYPKITCVCSDADDTAATGFVVKVTISNDTPSVIGTFDMSLKSGSTTEWELQTTATHLPAYDGYTFQAYGYDGTLYSGAVTVEADADKSDVAYFSYLAGPTVAIDSPTDDGTFGTATPTVTWTASTQSQKRTQIRRVSTGATVYDSGWLIDTTQSQAVPAGHITGNLTDFDFDVQVKDGSGLIGQDIHTATLSYTPADPVDEFVAIPYTVGSDGYSTVVRTTWDSPSVIDSEFLYFAIYRSDQPDTPVAVLDSPTDVAWIDYEVPTGQDLTYTIFQVADREGETVEGTPASDNARVDIEGVVMHSIANPGEERLAVRAWQSRRFNTRGTEDTLRPRSGGPPSTYRDGGLYWVGEITLVHHPILGEPSQEVVDRAELLAERGGPICLRDSLGKRRYFSIERDDGFAVNVLRNRSVELIFRLREERTTA